MGKVASDISVDNPRMIEAKTTAKHAMSIEGLMQNSTEEFESENRKE